jgi:hypothetical protein
MSSTNINALNICYRHQRKAVCLTGELWIFAYKFLIIAAVKPPWCLSEV